MYFRIRCPQCGQNLRLPKEAVGRTAVCGTCQATFPVSQSDPNPSSATNVAQGVQAGAITHTGRPHRGGLILALAIIGIMLCPIVSFVAWVLGRSDLKSMQHGVMDADGKGLTKAGTIVAMVHCILMIAGFAAWLLFIAVVIAAQVL